MTGAQVRLNAVVDASVVFRWFFSIDRTQPAEDLIRAGVPLIAPDLVLTEMANAAWKLVNFESFSAVDAAEILRNVPSLFDELVPAARLLNRALEIAVDLHHPAYGCFYLALAEQRNCQMVTANDRLVAKCARSAFSKLVKPLVSAPSGRRR